MLTEEILTEKNEFSCDELKMFIIKAKNGISKMKVADLRELVYSQGLVDSMEKANKIK